jgi:SPP1 gp7 family putative phage head morphogenesis protein
MIMGLLNFFRKKQNIPKYYKNYPEIPYISPNRDMEDWIKKVSMFPNMVVKREMMIRNEDGLLPGHVYMLYWLNKYTNKRVPVYFEYKYGLDFEKEVHFLQSKGFLNVTKKPTEKGFEIIKKYQSIIDKHNEQNHKKTDEEIYQDTIKSIISTQKNFLRNGFNKYEYIGNHDSCPMCKKLDGQVFELSELKIGVNAPPMHKKCRCSIAPHLDRDTWDRELGKRSL